MLEELQSLDEKTKKRVLIIATIIIMVIIIGVWVTYFNSIVIGTATPQATSTSALGSSTPFVAVTASGMAPSVSVATATNGPGLWQDIVGFFRSFANIFRSPSNYTIQPQGN